MIEHSEYGTGAIVAILVSEAIELLKRAGWCPLTYDSDKANRMVGAIAAFVSGIGIGITFDPATGTLVVTGLLWATVKHGLAQWAGQMLYYRLAVKGTQSVPEPRLIREE